MIDAVGIVGAGIAGVRAAETLRHNGFDGRVLLIGDEQRRPYERPPLSKDYLLGGSELCPTMSVHDEDWYADQRVELMLGTRVDAIDARAGGLRLADGSTQVVDRILLATGGQPRRLKLEGGDAPNVHYLRSQDDADGLASALRPGAALAIIGMGVIGAEIAATARKIGCDVTVIEPAPSPMLRTVGQRFGSWLGQVHVANGVTCRFGTGVTRLITGADGDVRAIECDDGSRVNCDAVVVGIGIDPSVGLARTAGLALGNGIAVDSGGRTSHPNIFAAGDVAEQPGFDGGRVRLETFHNAAEQSAAAARSMLDEQVNYGRPCRFWSEQYDLDLQMVGRLDDRLRLVLRGEIDSSVFTAFFLDGDVVAGALSVNRSIDVGPVGRLVEQRVPIDPADLSNPGVPLRELLQCGSSSRPLPRPVSNVDTLVATSAPQLNDLEPAEDELRLCRSDDVEADEPLPVLVEGLPPLAVYEVEGAFYVTDNTCTHGRAELTDGMQEGLTIECPFHGGAFDITTGAPTAFPCVRPLRTYPARLEDGWIVIDRPEEIDRPVETVAGAA